VVDDRDAELGLGPPEGIGIEPLAGGSITSWLPRTACAALSRGVSRTWCMDSDTVSAYA